MPRLSKTTANPAVQDSTKKKTKSRNGCQRCKLKRLKCDETKPFCVNCKNRGIECPGYQKSLKWSQKYEVFDSSFPSGKNIQHGNQPSFTAVGLPPDVVSGFQEALAAVLPSRERPRSKSPQVNEIVVDRDQERRDERSTTPQVEEITTQPSFDDLDVAEEDPPFFDEIHSSILDDFLIDLDAEDDGGSILALPDLDTSIQDLDVQELETVAEEQSVSAVGSRLSRSLLLDYYRLPRPSIQPSLDDMNSMLVRHYFGEVCGLYSSFDSDLNPFRMAVARVYQTTPSIYYAIQSMAAAQLANTFPYMSQTGIEMQQKAYSCLHEELQLVGTGQVQSGKTMLAILLLGLSTCWHDSGDLGLPHLMNARNLILPKLLEADSSEQEEIRRDTQFFEEALIYWEMLVGFVSHEAMTLSPVSGFKDRFGPNKAGSVTRKPNGKIVPHPWTGIAPKVQMLFAEVGRLVRRERMLHLTTIFDFDEVNEILTLGAALEEELLAAEFPLAEELEDIGDEKTSKFDFIYLSEAYRCAGLLEIHRIFPSILRKRLGTENFTSLAEDLDLNFPMPRFETQHESTDTKIWINSLALHILNTLEKLPSTSGTCSLQPILFVTASSELRFVSSLDYFDLHANDAKILHARRFAAKRLDEFMLRLPAKPLRRMSELIKEVWRRSDSGEDVFWMDVMIENGWHTIMG